MVEEKVVVKMQMLKEAIKTIQTLKTKMNVSTEAEVIRNALSLLIFVEKARNTPGNIVIRSKRLIPGYDKVIDLLWD